MSRYVSDQNKVVMKHESGTYTFTSGNGVWIGQVISNDITDTENLIETRYLGTGSRSFGELVGGARDVTGTVTYHPQDMRLPFWTIGSVWEGGTTNFYHCVAQISTDVQQCVWTSGTGQISAPQSFTLEDSKQAPGTGRNFIRTIIGCVPDSTTITATQGEKVTVECNYIGQSLLHSSGATTSVTALTTTPYLWSDCKLTMIGSVMDTVKEVSIEINNNTEAPHYVNGSRVIGAPFRLNRNITMNVTADLDCDDADLLYTDLYKANGSFNVEFDMNKDSATAGSMHAVFCLSGCKISDFTAPSANEGVTEASFTITAQNIAGSAFDRIQYYNPEF